MERGWYGEGRKEVESKGASGASWYGEERKEGDSKGTNEAIERTPFEIKHVRIYDQTSRCDGRVYHGIGLWVQGRVVLAGGAAKGCGV